MSRLCRYHCISIYSLIRDFNDWEIVDISCSGSVGYGTEYVQSKTILCGGPGSDLVYTGMGMEWTLDLAWCVLPWPAVLIPPGMGWLAVGFDGSDGQLRQGGDPVLSVNVRSEDNNTVTPTLPLAPYSLEK